ncbi:MAG: acetylornithine/N-succinyldiaminopimelate aminotransferase [Syntrophus sp. SKADARSKE-3]|nr:acetylornithine/N-succinyldiaminopimelate aminotransferase [Syntrophus sp. SKADARSKE-3]
MDQGSTFFIEDHHTPPFFKKMPVSIDRGQGVNVWDEQGRRYLDMTAGWGVTCLGHSHPAIIEALEQQSRKIMQNPNSGATYSPARARLLSLMAEILPSGLTRVFFQNSGAEANDAVIKLARKVTGRMDVVSTYQSFHGRTISTASATGQAKHRDKFNPLMPNYRFVAYDRVDEIADALDDQVAAVVLEPIQGEGGVIIPAEGYLKTVSALCEKNGTLLIIDEVQTGFCRTGPLFATAGQGLTIAFLTMAKGIAGGFPFGAFAMSEAVADRLELGDHGGTYSGNPLGCAVSHAVIKYLIDHDIASHVERMGSMIQEELNLWHREFPFLIKDVRGRGLLIAMEVAKPGQAMAILEESLRLGLFVNVTQGNIIRLFPALNITPEEVKEGLAILRQAVEYVVVSHRD